MTWVEWAWVVIWSVGFVVEMIGVYFDGRRGIEPLTTIVRDRLMVRFRWFHLAVFLFWCWLGYHFFLERLL